MKHDYGTVADFLRSHPDATLDMMTPGGFVLLTPELGAGLLAGGTVPAHPGCPGGELERSVGLWVAPEPETLEREYLAYYNSMQKRKEKTA